MDIAAQLQALLSQPPPGVDITELPIGEKPYTTPYYSVGKEICENLYLERAASPNAKASYYLIKTPGLRRLTDVAASTGSCRNMLPCSGRCFGVWGNTLQEILYDGSRVIRGTLATTEGFVSMAFNGALLMLVDGKYGYIYKMDDANFTRIQDEYFPGNDIGVPAPTSVAYLTTHFVVNVQGNNQYYYSNPGYTSDLNNTSVPYDPTILNGYWTPLQSGQMIGKPDMIRSLANVNNFLWLWGDQSTEVHYDTGVYQGQQFQRYQGALLNVGLAAAKSVAVLVNNVYFLGTDNNGTVGVYTNDGFIPKRISVPGIEQMIQSGKYSDAYGFCYAQNSHMFYVLQCPGQDRCYVYDIVTDAWHIRTYLDRQSGLVHRWQGSYSVTCFDKVLVGDRGTSDVYFSDPTYYVNDTGSTGQVNFIRCIKTLPISFSMGRWVRYSCIQILCNPGNGLSVNIDGVGVDPKMQVAWSDDNGITYSNERIAYLGKQGQYNKRTRVLACGIGRNRVFRLACTDPVPLLIVGVLVSTQASQGRM